MLSFSEPISTITLEMSKQQKVVTYTDPLNDDFAGTKIKRIPLGPKFKYVHKNIFWRFFATIIYRAFALPILWCVAKIGYGVKVYGKKNIREIRHKGVFFYGNHTMIADAWNPQIFAMGGKRGYILANQDATSIKGVRWLVQMMGCMPVPETLEENAAFKEAIAYRIKQKAGIVIYPERHIWPYYTHIRPFPDDSFVYPAELLAPVVAIAVTYRQRRLFKKCSPRMTMHISKPFYPDPKLSLADRKKQLRDDVYAFLLRHASEDENVEWIRYVKADKSKERAD